MGQTVVPGTGIGMLIAPTIMTRRLRVSAANLERLRAGLEGSSRLGELLSAEAPGSRAGPLHERSSVEAALKQLDRDRLAVGWWLWYVIRRGGDSRADRLVGASGFEGVPSEDGTVRIGCFILPEERRRGYAREAVSALVPWAFEDSRVRRVVAETSRGEAASIGLLDGCGFVGPFDESGDGVVRYECTRQEGADEMGPRWSSEYAAVNSGRLSHDEHRLELALWVVRHPDRYPPRMQKWAVRVLGVRGV